MRENRKIIVEHNDINPWMLPFAKEDILNIRDIEQGLENLQQEPGVDVKINIEPGTKHGYSTIRISTNRENSGACGRAITTGAIKRQENT